MPYLNLDLDFFEHPKIRRLIGLLGKGSEIYPIRIWCHCGKYHVADGRMRGYSPKEVEAIAGYEGTDGAMLQAMLTVGLLEGDEKSGFRVHDWKETNGHLIAFKKRAKQAASIRWGHATSIAKRPVKQSPNQPYHTVPTQPTVPDQPRATEPKPDPPKPSPPSPSNLDILMYAHWGREWQTATQYERTAMVNLWTKHGPEKFAHATEESSRMNKKSVAYVTAILEGPNGKAQARADEERMKKIKQYDEEIRAKEMRQ